MVVNKRQEVSSVEEQEQRIQALERHNADLDKSNQELLEERSQMFLVMQMAKNMCSSPSLRVALPNFAKDLKEIISFDHMVLKAENLGGDTGPVCFEIGLSQETEEEVWALTDGKSSSAEENDEVSRAGLDDLSGQALQRFSDSLVEEQSGIIYESCIGTSLMVDDVSVGTIELFSHRPEAFGSRETGILQQISTLIYPAISHAALQHDLHIRSRTRALFAKISSLLTSSLNTGRGYEKLLEHLREEFSVDWMAINILARDANFMVRHQAGLEMPGRQVNASRPLFGSQTEYVVNTGQSLVRADIGENQHFSTDPEHLSRGLRSSMMVPLKSAGRVIGTMSLRSTEIGAYGPEEQAIFEGLAEDTAPLVENTALYQQLRVHARELELVDEIGRIIVSNLEIEQVYKEFFQRLKELVPFDRAVINLVSEDTGTYVGKYTDGVEPLRGVGQISEWLVQTHSGLVASTKRSQISDNLKLELRFPSDEGFVAAGLISCIGVPLLDKGKVIATLVLRSFHEAAFGPREQAILERLATQIAPALVNAELYKKVQESAEEMRLVEEVAQVITSTLEIEEVYEEFGRKLQKIVDVERISINRIDYDEQTLTLKYAFGRPRPDRPIGISVPLKGSDTEQVLKAGRTVIRNNEDRDHLSPKDYFFPTNGMVSSLLVPLISKGEIIGSMGYHSSNAAEFSERKIAILERLAGQIAPAIQNAELFEERKRSEEVTRESEEKFRTFFETALNAIVITSGPGRIMQSNPSFQAMLGYSAEELAQMTVAEVTHPADREASVEAISNLLTGDVDRFRMEKRYVAKDGRILWGDVAVSAVRAPDGTLRYSFAMIEDITEKKLASDTLEAREKEVRTLMDRIPDGLSVVVKGKVVHTNAAVTALTGYSQKELIGNSPDMFLHPDDRELAARRIGEIMNYGPEYPSEYRILRKDGTFIHAEVSSRLAEYGGEIALISLIRDLTTRREADEKIRILSRAVEQSPVSVVVTDLKDTIEYVNPSYTQISGYPEDEAVGKQRHTAGLGSNQSNAEPMAWRSSGPESEWQREIQNKRKNGDSYWAHETVSPIRDAAGNITHYLVLEQDISEQKLLETQLLQSQKMETVGRLAGGVAHDFNNLLTAITGYAQMALESMCYGCRNKEDIQEILNASASAANLVNQLMIFSRRQPSEPKLVNLNKLILNLDRMLRRLIGEDVELVTLPANRLSPVKVDASQMEQVLMNLSVNARDAMTSGGILTVETRDVMLAAADLLGRPDQPPGPYVCLSVKDNGVGISKENQRHIFEPFFTTKGVGEGTGLGLATCYGIVAQSGGFIDVESEEGVGSTFSIYLPVATEVPEPDIPNKGAAEQAIGTETVLLAEDEPLVRSVVAKTLRRQGFHVVEASNGEEALRVYLEDPSRFDVLVTDVVMPKISGPELVEQLRTFEPRLKVVFTSGYAEGGAVKLGSLPPGTSFLQKPYMPAEMVTKVRQILDTASA